MPQDKMIVEFTANSVDTSETDQYVNNVILSSETNEYLLVGEWLVEDDRKGLYAQYMDVENSTDECIEKVYLDRNLVVLDVSRPIKNFENVSGFRVTLKLSDIDFKDLGRAMANLFDRYPGVLKVEA